MRTIIITLSSILTVGVATVLSGCHTAKRSSAPPAVSSVPAENAGFRPIEEPPQPGDSNCVAPPPERRALLAARLADWTRTAAERRIESEEADAAAASIAEELNSAQTQRNEEQSALNEAQSAAGRLKVRVEHDTMLAREGALAERLLVESQDAFHDAELSLRSTASAEQAAEASIVSLEMRQQQLAARSTECAAALQQAEAEKRDAQAALDRFADESCVPAHP